jgi:homoserine dehydrogenase
MDEVRIGLLGCGTVGTGVIRILNENGEGIKARLGCPISIVGVAVRHLEHDRPDDVNVSLLTDDAAALVRDGRVDIVVEAIGGLEPARTLVLDALKAGKHVVTANKALLACHGPELFEAAEEAQRDLAFEAAVGGGIPIIRMLREGLASDRLTSLHGIINGTSNFILSAMSKDGRPYDDVLREAQAAGFAEADPSMDVEGTDAAQKLAILMSLGFGAQIDFKEILTEGIDDLEAQDIAYAEQFGYSIKSLAIARDHQGAIEARVHPTLIPQEALMSAVDGVFNAILTTSHAMGDSLFYGKGAGMLPTAMSVVSDVVEVGRNVVSGRSGRLPHLAFHRDLLDAVHLRPHDEIVCPNYLRFAVRDEPGVVANIAAELGSHGISISQMMQPTASEGERVDLIIFTHDAREGDLRKALGRIESLPSVLGPTKRIRIEGNL